MTALPLGVYEQILSEYLQDTLSSLDHNTTEIFTEPLDQGDSYASLSHYLKQVISGTLDSFEGEDKLTRQIDLCNRIIRLLHDTNPRFIQENSKVSNEGLKLLSILKKNESSSLKEPLKRPDTPLAFGCLLTGTRLDPSLVSQIKKEILSSDSIDILCSFIKWSGLRIIKDELYEFACRPNTKLRIITTSYMGATDAKAIEQLAEFPNTEIRVSYDTHRTRLHAKAYIFRRSTGFGSAYVGSANLAHAALTDGLEWTVKISQYETAHLWQKVTATFESYWNDKEFVLYRREDHHLLQAALKDERTNNSSSINVYIFDLRPYAFQQEILDRLEAERHIHGLNRHLVVAATGTGKTMIAAFDYRSWCVQNTINHKRPRLLYIVHREEILKQGITSFRAVLRDQNFGDLLVGGFEPTSMENLFVSIQAYNSRQLTKLPPDFYDYVVVDEFHHAAAPIYKNLLNHIKPKVLLGLTATPERADGLDIIQFFNSHISAQIRLPDAINRKLLCPFQYFGISDSVDLNDVKWQRGGYAIDDLNARYTGNDIRSQLIINKVKETLLDVKKVRGIGFCVSIAHANYMAEQFNRNGIAAEALSSETTTEQRRTAQDRLRNLEINFIFVVDLYNEGIDIPEIDTVLFLRPTESLTVFLQQLGRGLRLYESKDYLTVLDFVGRAGRNFRFDLRFRALLSNQHSSLEDQISYGFSYLPAGCSIQLERKAKEYILENIRSVIRQSRQTLVQELSTFAQGLGRRPSLKEFLEFFKLDLDEIYKRGISWSRLCVEAGISKPFNEPDEILLTKGIRRIQHISSAFQIQTLLQFVNLEIPLPENCILSEPVCRLISMMHFSLWSLNSVPNNVVAGIERLRNNPNMCSDLIEVLRYKFDQIDSVSPNIELPFLCPMTLYSQYTRDEILAALGYWTLQNQPELREGVLHLPNIKTDIFLVTLNKTERDFSQTTMYRDYAISDTLFHWQSQSTTSTDSNTGKRYIEHLQRGYTILLFIREHKKSNNLSCPFNFLGPVEYVSHEGNRPINIVLRLKNPLPATLLRKTAKLI